MTTGTDKVYISIVTWNRCKILEQVIEGIEQTIDEPYQILVTDNGSSDGTGGMLMAMQTDKRLRAYLLSENVGISKARNHHWSECIGHDTLRLDDKLLINTPGWSRVLRLQSELTHSLLSFIPPDQQSLWHLAPTENYISFSIGAAIGQRCGASIFIPAEVTKSLGYWCEDYGIWGFEDIDYIDRANVIAWRWGYTLRVEAQTLARGNQAMKNLATAQYQPIYEANKQAYINGEKDTYLER